MRFRPRRALVIAVLGWLLAAPALATVESELAFHRGVVAFGQERLDEARTLFEKVLELDPNDTVAIHYLALIAQKQGDPARARELIERGLALDPDDPDLLVDLGVLQLQAGQTAEARATFDRVLAVRPDDARAHLFAGIAAYRAGAYSDATPHLDRAVALDPTLAMQARYYAGLSEAFLGNLPVAEGAFDDVATASPQHPLAQSAQRLRDEIRQPEPERPWTLSLSAGGEYDSNPLLSGETIPRDDDYRGVFRARGTYRVFERGGFTLSSGAEGYWSIHHEEDKVDLQTYLGFLNANYALGPVLFGLNYDFVYTFIDFDDPFRMVNRDHAVALRARGRHRAHAGLLPVQPVQFPEPEPDDAGARYRRPRAVRRRQPVLLPAGARELRARRRSRRLHQHRGHASSSTRATSCSRAPRSRCRSIRSSSCSTASPIATSTTAASFRATSTSTRRSTG